MVQFAFNAAQVPFAEPGLPVWEGMVPIQIMRTEVKPTAAANGSNMLIFHVAAIAGDYRGQENVIRLNIWNANTQAVDIAQRQLSSIAHCTNRMQFTDTDQLIGGQLLTVWAKEEREVTDPTTGQKRKIDSCQVKDFRLLDGRTIREAMGGQPASQPYSPTSAPAVQSAGQPSIQAQFNPGAPQPQAGPQPGFQQPGPSAAPQPGFVQPTPGAAPAFQPASGPGGFQPQQPGPGMQGAASGFSPPQQPQAGPGPWGPGQQPR